MSVPVFNDEQSRVDSDRDVDAGLGATAPRRRLSWLRQWRRPRWWQELLFIGGSYFLYTLTRNSVPAHALAAMHHATSLLGFERAVHVDVERTVNAALAGVKWLAVVADYYYATLHFVITIGVLLWLYVKHPLRYRGPRTALYATNIIALVGFWLYPLAPPRMLPGFVDTIINFHTWGSWGSGDVASMSNQFAAMPSLHIAWALWSGLTLWHLARPMWARIAGAIYPILTLLVIVGTANHFLLDAVGGAAALAGGFAVQRVISGRSAYALPGSTTRRRPATVDLAR